MNEVMIRNIKVLILVTLILGFMQGVFDLIFPFYLEYRGLSLASMGFLFTVSHAVDEFIQVFVGDYTDRMGRKKVYSGSFLIGAIANFFFTIERGVLELSFTKILNDIAGTIRRAVSSVMVFENSGRSFPRFIAYTRGGGLIIQAIGFFTAVYIMEGLGYTGCFYIIAAFDLITFAIIIYTYKEGMWKKREKVPLKTRLKETYSFNISRNLKIFSVVAGLHGIGNQLSHTFSLPLYFAGKYGLAQHDVALILALHRFAMVPMLFSNRLIQKTGLRTIYPIALLAYAFSFLLSGLVNNVWIMIPIWLIHDVVGGSIRVPAHDTLVQGFARSESRARDTDSQQFITEFMTMFAPMIAATLATISWDLMFLGGSAFVFAATALFVIFIKDVPEDLWEKRKERK